MRPKDIGTAGETAVVRFLRDNGFPNVERRALHGAVDMGDITGTPGLVWDPPTVQCDECAATYTSRTLARAVLGSGFHFNPRREHDQRRLCRDCAKAAGWQR